MCDCLTFQFTFAVHDRLATDVLRCSGYLNASSIVSPMTLKFVDLSL